MSRFFRRLTSRRNFHYLFITMFTLMLMLYLMNKRVDYDDDDDDDVILSNNRVGLLKIDIPEEHISPLQITPSAPTGIWVSETSDAKTKDDSSFPNCEKIFQGDEKEVELAKQSLWQSERDIYLDEYYIQATRNCSHFKKTHSLTAKPLSDLEAQFPIAYIITVHENAEQVFRLLRAIYQPQNVYCIHVDKKSQFSFLSAIQHICRCFSNVFVSSHAVNVVYGHFSRLTADFYCQRDLFNSNIPWKYMINLAGQDFPLKNNRDIVRYLMSLNGKNDIPGVIPKLPTFKTQQDRITHRHILVVKYDKKKRLKTIDVVRTKVPKLPPPHNTTIYFGNAYYMATRAFIKYALFSTQAYRLLKWMTDVHSPDEFYWATLQRIPGTPGGTTEGSWKSHIRAIKWKHFAGKLYPPCQGKYRHNICVFGVGDLQWLSKQRPLFANKFSLDVDHIAFKCLEERLLNRSR